MPISSRIIGVVCRRPHSSLRQLFYQPLSPSSKAFTRQTYRHYSHSTGPRPPNFQTSSSSPGPNAEASPRSRLSRLHSRLPRFLQRYTTGLLNAPVSHVAAFLILHEITAIVPLIGLGWWFYRNDTLPWFAEGRYFDEGMKRIGKYFKRKGWLGKADEEKLGMIERQSTSGGLDAGKDKRDNGKATQRTLKVDERDDDSSRMNRWLGSDKWIREGDSNQRTKREKWWGRGEDGVHLVSSVAAAYALTKILLPVRLITSIWATPAAARVAIIPFMSWSSRILARVTGVFKKKT